MNLDDLSLSERMQTGCCAPPQSPTGGADCVGHGMLRLYAMGVLARRPGCDIETGGRPVETERRETRAVASVLEVTARAARCYIA
jgi:hypothetical protein